MSFSPVASAGSPGVASAGGIEHIETQVVSGASVTEVNFAAALDGDSDGDYLLKTVWVPKQITNCVLRLKFNGGVFAATTGILLTRAGLFQQSSYAGGIIAITASTGFSTDNNHFCLTRLSLKTGKRRHAVTSCSLSQSNIAFVQRHMVTVITETETNVVSLGIDTLDAGGIDVDSRFELYRVGA